VGIRSGKRTWRRREIEKTQKLPRKRFLVDKMEKKAWAGQRGGGGAAHWEEKKTLGTPAEVRRSGRKDLEPKRGRGKIDPTKASERVGVRGTMKGVLKMMEWGETSH